MGALVNRLVVICLCRPRSPHWSAKEICIIRSRGADTSFIHWNDTLSFMFVLLFDYSLLQRDRRWGFVHLSCFFYAWSPRHPRMGPGNGSGLIGFKHEKLDTVAVRAAFSFFAVLVPCNFPWSFFVMLRCLDFITLENVNSVIFSLLLVSSFFFGAAILSLFLAEHLTVSGFSLPRIVCGEFCTFTTSSLNYRFYNYFSVLFFRTERDCPLN